MAFGKVIKTQNSFFYLKSDTEMYVCKLRGKLKKYKESVTTGDNVRFSLISGNTGVIEERLERTNYLRRPPVANIDQVLLVFALMNPAPSILLIDRFLVLAEWSGIKNICLCFNKADISDGGLRLKELYEKIGYRVIVTSSYTEQGIAELRQLLENKVTVFAGPSGVGKSSLLNALSPGLSLRTGDLSDKIKRGRHTTRLAQLLSFGLKGYLVDTPGFSMVDFEELSEPELVNFFPELLPYKGACHYYGCSHSHEPGCEVKTAVEDGRLVGSRYESYLNILSDIRELQKRRK